MTAVAIRWWLALGVLIAPVALVADETAGSRVDRVVIAPFGDGAVHVLVSRPGEPPITLVVPVHPASWYPAGGYWAPMPPLAPPAPAPPWRIPYLPYSPHPYYPLAPDVLGPVEGREAWRQPGVRYERHAGGTVLRSRAHPGGRVEMRPGETRIRSRVSPGERVERHEGGVIIRSRP